MSLGTSPISEHYDRVASRREYFQQLHQGFHLEKRRFYSALIPSGRRVLEVGCGLGDLLAGLDPSEGVGVDFSGKTLEFARKRNPKIQFIHADAEEIPVAEPFDYILLDGLLGELPDIQHFLRKLKVHCHERTRLVISWYSKLWQPAWLLWHGLGWKLPQPKPNWLRTRDILNFLNLEDYEPVEVKRRVLLPLGIPGLDTIANQILVNLPLIQNLGMVGLIIARLSGKQELLKQPSVSIVIPCRNERENIASALKRIPKMGSRTEIIFCDGNSTDGTMDEIIRQTKLHPEWKIISFSQGEGKGKGDAVRQAFARADGDVLMILDADLTMPPEELPKFYQCLVEGKAEFVNGCRLVYPMEHEAMQHLNLVANWFFGVLFTWLIDQPVRDTLCGTKVLYRKDYEKICANRSYFGDFDPFGDFDLLFGASKLHLKIMDLPIRYKARIYGTTNISRFRHGLLLFRMSGVAMFKLKFI